MSQSSMVYYMTAIIPTLSVRNGSSAIEFYKRAFGAIEKMRNTGDDGSIVAELMIESSRFYIADESPENGNYSPESLNGSSVRLGLLVSDPDKIMNKAIEAGAREIYPVEDQDYGLRLGRIVDPYGHHWEIFRPLSNEFFK